MTLLKKSAILDRADCLEASDDVRGLEEHWLPSGGAPGRFRLGAAAGADSGDSYSARATAYNRLLWNHFGRLYQRVQAALRSMLRAEVTYNRVVALPGFEIAVGADAAELFRDEEAGFDTRYVDLWGVRTASFVQAFSFALPLQVPDGGAGLNLWPLTLDTFRLLRTEFLLPLRPGDVAAAQAPVYEPYEPGMLYLYPSQLLHQAASGPPGSPVVPARGARIVLQGAGIFLDGVCQLYC
jgi:hypothetical protein